MKTLIVAVTAFFMCWGVLPAAETLGDGNSASLLSCALSHEGVRAPFRGKIHPATQLNTLALPDHGLDREETRFRRFEIVFFTSLPASVLLSLLGVIAFRSAAGHTGGLSAVEYRYLALSTVSMSLCIAASDSRNAYGDKTYRRGHR
jgi:hypothetical protein